MFEALFISANLAKSKAEDLCSKHAAAVVWQAHPDNKKTQQAQGTRLLGRVLKGPIVPLSYFKLFNNIERALERECGDTFKTPDNINLLQYKEIDNKKPAANSLINSRPKECLFSILRGRTKNPKKPRRSASCMDSVSAKYRHSCSHGQ